MLAKEIILAAIELKRIDDEYDMILRQHARSIANGQYNLCHYVKIIKDQLNKLNSTGDSDG